MTRGQAGKLDEISAAIGEMRADVKHVHDCIHRVENNMDTRLAAMETKVDDLVALRQRGVGFAMALSAIAGFIGSKFPAIAHLLGRAAG